MVQGAVDSTTSDTTPPVTPPRTDPEWLTELFDNLDEGISEGGAGSERREPRLPVGSPTILNHGQDSMAPRTARLQDVRAECDEPRTTADSKAVQPSVQPNLQPESTARSTGTDVLGLPRTATRLRTSVTARTT